MYNILSMVKQIVNADLRFNPKVLVSKVETVPVKSSTDNLFSSDKNREKEHFRGNWSVQELIRSLIKAVVVSLEKIIQMWKTI